eukprot:gene10443-biopygen1696
MRPGTIAERFVIPHHVIPTTHPPFPSRHSHNSFARAGVRADGALLRVVGCLELAVGGDRGDGAVRVGAQRETALPLGDGGGGYRRIGDRRIGNRRIGDRRMRGRRIGDRDTWQRNVVVSGSGRSGKSGKVKKVKRKWKKWKKTSVRAPLHASQSILIFVLLLLSELFCPEHGIPRGRQRLAVGATDLPVDQPVYVPPFRFLQPVEQALAPRRDAAPHSGAELHRVLPRGRGVAGVHPRRLPRHGEGRVKGELAVARRRARRLARE